MGERGGSKEGGWGEEGGKMALSEDQSSLPRVHTGCLATTCNSDP